MYTFGFQSGRWTNRRSTINRCGSKLKESLYRTKEDKPIIYIDLHEYSLQVPPKSKMNQMHLFMMTYTTPQYRNKVLHRSATSYVSMTRIYIHSV